MLVVNDDPQIRDLVSGLLKKAVGAEERDRVQARHEAFQKAWGADLPFVSRSALLAIGPRWDAAACAGTSDQCVTSWRAWAAREDRALGATTALDTASGAPE